MPQLSDFTCENNPVEKQHPNLLKHLKEKFPCLNFYNLQKVSTLFDVSLQQQNIANKISQRQQVTPCAI